MKSLSCELWLVRVVAGVDMLLIMHSSLKRPTASFPCRTSPAVGTAPVGVEPLARFGIRAADFEGRAWDHQRSGDVGNSHVSQGPTTEESGEQTGGSQLPES